MDTVSNAPPTPSAFRPPAPGDLAGRLAAALQQATGQPLRFGLKLWDGSTTGPATAPAAVLTSPRALRHVLFRPGHLGCARAFVCGDLTVDGDLTDFLHQALPMVLALRPLTAARRPQQVAVGALGALDCLRQAGAWPLPPPRPRSEGGRYMRRVAAVRHHYDAGNSLYELILGPSLVYSCACWPDPAHPEDLEGAQRTKLEAICRKLALRPGARLLDVGCGWGSLLVHAAEHHGVRAVGVTLAREQAAYARDRIERAGLADRVEVRLCDYREVDDGPFDAIASVEVTQHLGRRELKSYGRRLHALLRAGGLLLAHDVYIAPAHGARQDEAFVHRYVTPRLRIRTLDEGIECLHQAGLEVLAVENLRGHFGPTFRAWLANLETNWDRAVATVGAERARAWQLFLAGGALACERNWTGAAHILAARLPSIDQ